jgi:uncharacterized protein DUF1837
MSIFDDWFDITTEVVNGHEYKAINIMDDNVEPAASDIAQVVPVHYITPESIARTLERLGKPAAAEKLRAKLPQTKNIRSGDLGEILATEYIDSQTEFDVPIRKLRWHDHREMAMRGDDVIGIMTPDNGHKPRFLKTEAKSRAALGRQVLNEAREALDADEGRPAPHALAFVADRLREAGNTELADIIDDAQWRQGITIQQMEHLLFTFTRSNPDNLQKETLEAYDGNIKQNAAGLRITTHQQFIADVFDEVENGLDD